MEDNEVFIDTTLNVKGVELGAKEVNKALENMADKASQAANSMSESIGSSFQNIDIDKEIDKTIKKIDELIERQQKYVETGGKTDNRAFKAMEYDIDRLRERLVALQQAKKADTSSWQNNAKAVNDVTKNHKKMSLSVKKSNTSFKDGIKTVLKYAFGIRSLFVLVNKLRNALVEGFKNLAQFNDGANPTNEALSNLKSSLTQLKNSLATAFAPILQVIQPILTGLIDKISQVATAIGMLFAKLSGASTFTKAIKVQENYAASLGNTAKEAKKAKGQLASFDELNVLNKEDESGGSGGGSVDPNQMFETVGIESNIAGFADRIMAIMEPLKESLFSWFSDVDFEPLIDSFNGLLEAVEPLAGAIGDGLLWLLENVLEPLGSFTIENLLPAFFDLLSSAVTACLQIFEALKPTLLSLWNDIFVPIAQFLGDIFITIIDAITSTISQFGDMFVEKMDKVNGILKFFIGVIQLVWMAVKTVVQFILGLIKPFLKMVVNIIGDIIDILAGLIEFITGVFTGDWEKAWDGIKDIFKGIFNAIIDIVEGVLNMIIGGINKIRIEVPEWVPGIGGTVFGFNIREIEWPRLAQGTVVPKSSKEFAAILGDNNRETEVVSPLSTMKQAMIEALAEVGGIGGSGDVYISADGDMDALIRLLNLKIEKENKRVGRNFEKVVYA